MNDPTEPQDVHHWCVEGALNIYTALDLKTQLLQALEQPGALHLDLHSVDDMDTAGMQLLVLAQRECERLGKSLVLQYPSESVMDVLLMYRMESAFVIESADGLVSRVEAPTLEDAHG